MKSLKKRVFTTALAGAMALTMAVPAFAAEEAPTNTQTKIEATYQAIPIAVTVPADTTAVVNPLGLPYEIGTLSSADAATTVTGHEIATIPIGIRNEGSSDLSVSATVTATTKGNLKLIASADSIDGKDAVGNENDEDYQPAVPKSTANNAFVYLQMKGITAATSDADDATVADAIITTAGATSWSTTYSADNDLVLSSTKAQTKNDMFTLKKPTVDTDGTVTAYTANSIAVVRLAGRVVKAPKTAWATTDGFTATIAFTFTPSV